MDDSGGGRVYRSPIPYETARINAAAVYCSDGRIGDHMDEFLHQGLACRATTASPAPADRWRSRAGCSPSGSHAVCSISCASWSRSTRCGRWC